MEKREKPLTNDDLVEFMKSMGSTITKTAPRSAGHTFVGICCGVKGKKITTKNNQNSTNYLVWVMLGDVTTIDASENSGVIKEKDCIMVPIAKEEEKQQKVTWSDSKFAFQNYHVYLVSTFSCVTFTKGTPIIVRGLLPKEVTNKTTKGSYVCLNAASIEPCTDYYDISDIYQLMKTSKQPLTYPSKEYLKTPDYDSYYIIDLSSDRSVEIDHLYFYKKIRPGMANPYKRTKSNIDSRAIYGTYVIQDICNGVKVVVNAYSTDDILNAFCIENIDCWQAILSNIYDYINFIDIVSLDRESGTKYVVNESDVVEPFGDGRR